MSTLCALCGAQLLAGQSCEDIHQRLVGYDFDPRNAVPHAIHFLQVTCYMIQHDRYSDEALGWAQEMLRAHLDGGMDEYGLRRFVTSRLAGSDSTTRTWRFNRAPHARPLTRVAWSWTIVEVDHQMNLGASYAEAITQWARATLEQMPALLP